MRVPLGWLRDYVDLPESTEDIAERLAMLGFPVESIERRPSLSGVLIGRIATLERHPNAERLLVASVDVASDKPLVVATAATNVSAGDVVPVATVGAQLVREGAPLGIERRTMRGLASEGMLCSADELGFEAAWFEDGILLLDEDLPLGADAVELFRLRDDVLDVEVTSNRVDAMSIVGIARELGAAYRRDVRAPVSFTAVPTAGATEGSADGLSLGIATNDCRRFVAQRFSNVSVRRAPAWMRFRLALAGQRPLDAVVDTTNFVMLELGQPQHAYDVAKLGGARLIARDALPGERLVTLDGEEHVLTPQALVIADGDSAQGLAGLRGSAQSEVSPQTHEVVIESACFDGPRVRRMSIALGLRTDASSRHERGLPLAFADVGAARAAELLVATGATAHPPVAVGEAPRARPPIAVSPLRIGALIGIDLTRQETSGALRALGFDVVEADDTLRVTAPYWRNDVSIPADVAEEVARVVGYDRIHAESATIPEQHIPGDEYALERHVAHCCATAGYREVMTLSLQPRTVYARYVDAGVPPSHEPIEVSNPLSEEQRYLRFSLLPGLLALAAKHGGGAPLRLFEIGHVFERGDAQPLESAAAAWLALLPPLNEPSWRDSGFLAFKGESQALLRMIGGREADTVTAEAPALHPGKTAAMILDGRDVARIGAVDPRLVAAYDISGRVYAGVMRLHDVPPYRVPAYRAPSRYPAVERDLALVVASDVAAHEINHAVLSAGDGVIRDVRAFDEYRGPQVADGCKSIAVRLRFQRDDATLTDAEVDGQIQAVLAVLRDRLGAQIRR